MRADNGAPARRSVAVATVRKAVREVGVLGRRAQFAWRQRAGVLVFQEGPSSGGSQRSFAIGKKLGEGGYSTIWTVHEWQPDASERQYAVKRVVVDRRDAEQVALVEHEIHVMRNLPPHPNIVELIGTCKRKRGTAGGGAQDELFLLLELCRGGSLAELLMARAADGTPLSISEVGRTFYDMALALSHLHSQPQPLAHRDVKPENFILADGDGHWRLCDFGSATVETFAYVPGMASHAVAVEEETIHRHSTPQYRAPEMCAAHRVETTHPSHALRSTACATIPCPAWGCAGATYGAAKWWASLLTCGRWECHCTIRLRLRLRLCLLQHLAPCPVPNVADAHARVTHMLERTGTSCCSSVTFSAPLARSGLECAHPPARWPLLA